MGHVLLIIFVVMLIGGLALLAILVAEQIAREIAAIIDGADDAPRDTHPDGAA